MVDTQKCHALLNDECPHICYCYTVPIDLTKLAVTEKIEWTYLI